MVRSETDRFDSAFLDAAATVLGKAKPGPEDYGSAPLKLKTIEYLKDCETQLVNMIAKGSPKHVTQRSRWKAGPAKPGRGSGAK
jgi:hypothetical protein